MKIPVEPPFTGLWKHAYVVKNKENRNMVCLVNSNKDRTTIALARYRMSVKLGRMLRDDEQVDHIDNDKTNDSIDNLQLLTPEANRAKYLEIQPHNIHGTSSMYHKGCRCSLCIFYSREYGKQYRATHPDKIAQYKATGAYHKTVDKICPKCGKRFKGRPEAKFCSRGCANGSVHKIKIHASSDEILRDKEELGTWAAVARKYGVTSAALKWKLGVYKH